MNRGTTYWSVTISLVTLVLILCMCSYLYAATYEWGPTSLLNLALSNIVKAAPSDPNIVWVTTGNAPDPTAAPPDAEGIYKSTDRGVTWQKMNDATLLAKYNILCIAIHPTNPNIVYVGTNMYGVFKTTNGGTTWTAKNNGITHKGKSFPESTWGVSAIAINPHSTETIYCGVSNVNEVDFLGNGPDHPGFYRSIDGGNNWIAKNVGLPPREDKPTFLDPVSNTNGIASIVIDPKSAGTVYTGLFNFVYDTSVLNAKATSRGKVYWSQNNSDSWSDLNSNNGLPEISVSISVGSVFSLSLMWVAISKDATLYGVHYSTAGETDFITEESKYNSKGPYRYDSPNWLRKATGLPVVNDEYNRNSTNASPLAICPIDDDTLLVGISYSDMGDPYANDSKVYASTNRGEKWIKKWDEGMEYSPSGYSESNPTYIDINSNQRAAYAIVHWSDAFGPALLDDDGVYRMPPISELIANLDDKSQPTHTELSAPTNGLVGIRVQPNTFSSTTINYSITTNDYITLSVYDITGRLVSVLVDNRSYNPGNYSIKWDNQNSSAGVYYIVINTGGNRKVEKSVLIK